MNRANISFNAHENGPAKREFHWAPQVQDNEHVEDMQVDKIDHNQHFENVDHDNGNDEENCKFLRDNAAIPSQINHTPVNANSTEFQIHVTTANDQLTLKKEETVNIPTTAGKVHTKVLVNEKLTANLLSPLPIIDKKGPLLLTTTGAANLPPLQRITDKAMK